MTCWKEIELSDRKQVNDLLCASGCHGADYSFANLYIWRHAYKPVFCTKGQRIIVGMPHDKLYAYPKGAGDLRPSMEFLLDEAHKNNHKLKIRGLTDKTLEEFLPLYGNSFEITEDRDSADYIYTADKLTNLPGRKLSSKRNHINKFLRNGSWEFHPVVAASCASRSSFDLPEGQVASLAEAKAFVNEFYQEKADPELKEESLAIKEMFDNYESLGFLGGLLYQNEQPVAFTAGTRLDDEVFDIHFEKALPGVEGAYPMVNREFARLVVETIPEISHFNREEDMGIPGLRKAKESYHPDILLMKYFATEK